MVRLNKFLAERMGVSRREADDLIARGKILVDGQPAQIGARVDTKNRVSYRGKEIPSEAEYTYLLMNKPVGYVSSRRRQGDTPTLYEILPDEYQHLKTVGRLDKNTSGLIILTNDGDFAYKMTHPKFVKTKVYEVELDKPLAAKDLRTISQQGVDLPDGNSRLGLERLEDYPEDINLPPVPSKTKFRVTMHEGRNRQIRRTFDALGYTVIKLRRTAFGDYTLEKLRPGHIHEFQL